MLLYVTMLLWNISVVLLMYIGVADIIYGFENLQQILEKREVATWRDVKQEVSVETKKKFETLTKGNVKCIWYGYCLYMVFLVTIN